MPHIYLIFHPLSEPSYGRVTPKKIGKMFISPWNTSSSHHRKFIKRHGQYLESGILHDADLFFWGEYEPQSTYKLLYSTPPKAVHGCLCPVRHSSVPPKALNTDPYVFGNHFKFICCRRGRTKYQQGDVLLFGNIEDPSHFLLDTVLVIKEEVRIDPRLNTTQYYKASIEPMGKPLKYNTFYRGESYAPEKQYYSYVPCLLDFSVQPHPRMPQIDLCNLGFKVHKNCYGWTAAAIPLTPKRWKDIQKDVLSLGWLIGTYIDKI